MAMGNARNNFLAYEYMDREQLACVSDESSTKRCWGKVWRDRGVPLGQVNEECVASNDIMGGLSDSVQDKLRVVLDAIRFCDEGRDWLRENGACFSVEDDDYIIDPRKAMVVSSAIGTSLEGVVGRVAAKAGAAEAEAAKAEAADITQNFAKVRLAIVKCMALIEVIGECGSYDECVVVYEALMSVSGGAEMLSEAFFAIWVEKCSDVDEGLKVLSEMDARRCIRPDCAVAVALLSKVHDDGEFDRTFERFSGKRFAKGVTFLNMLLYRCENLDACIKVWGKVMANGGTADENSLKIIFGKCENYADGSRVFDSAKATYKLNSRDPIPEFCWRHLLELASQNADNFMAAVVEMQEYDRAVVLDPKYVRNLAVSPEVCIEVLGKFEEVFSTKSRISYAKVGGNPAHNFTVTEKPDFESLYDSYMRFGGAGKYKKIVMDVYGRVRLAALYHKEGEAAVCKCRGVDDFMTVTEWMIRDGVEPSEDVVGWAGSAEGVKRLRGMFGLRGRFEELFAGVGTGAGAGAGAGVSIGDLYQLGRAGATFEKWKEWVDFYGCVREAGLVDKVDDLMDFLRVVYEERERAKEAGDSYEYDPIAVPSGEKIEELFKFKKGKRVVAAARIMEFFAGKGYGGEDSALEMDEDMRAVYEYFGSGIVVKKRNGWEGGAGVACITKL